MFKFSTKQAIFEHAVTHLFTQGEKSVVDVENESGGITNACRYRHTNDYGKKLMCAIGACIPDELYNPTIEGRSVTSDELRAILPQICEFEYDKDTENMLARLQTTHDSFLELSWHEKFKEIARDYNLDLSFLDKVESPLLPKSTEV